METSQTYYWMKKRYKRVYTIQYIWVYGKYTFFWKTISSGVFLKRRARGLNIFLNSKASMNFNFLQHVCLLVFREKKKVNNEACESESHSVVFNSLWRHGLSSPWNSPGQNTGVGSPSLLQGIFPTQGSNPGLPHCRRILYPLSHWKPKNTGGDSLFLFQLIFPTQESNWGLLHCI